MARSLSKQPTSCVIDSLTSEQIGNLFRLLMINSGDGDEFIGERQIRSVNRDVPVNDWMPLLRKAEAAGLIHSLEVGIKFRKGAAS